MFCLDASVIISAARGTEQHSARSRRFLANIRNAGAKVFFPEIVIPEIVSGLFRATKRADFALEFARSLRAVPNFAFVAVDSRLADLAADLISKAGLRSADAVYAALALEYGLTLITLDQEQIRKARPMIPAQLP